MQLSQDLGYVMYSAFGSFYIPSCIMVFVYVKIYFAARERARRAVKVRRKSRRKSNRAKLDLPKGPATIVNPQVRSAPVVITRENNNHSNNNGNGISATIEIPASAPVQNSTGLPSALKRRTSNETNSDGATGCAEKKTTRFSFDQPDTETDNEEKKALLERKAKKSVQIMPSVSVSVSDSPLCDTPDTNTTEAPNSAQASPCPGHVCLANGTKARRSVGVQSCRSSSSSNACAANSAGAESEDDRASNSDSGNVRCLKLRTTFRPRKLYKSATNGGRRPSKETRT